MVSGRINVSSGGPPFDREIRLPPRGSGGRVRLILGVLVVLFFVGSAVAGRLADWLWYIDVGFERVFVTKIVAQWILGLAAGLGGFVFLYVNGRIALRDCAPKCRWRRQ